MKTLLFFIAAASIAHAKTFSLNSIERWTGAGTNRAALVVDWHDGTRPHALAWGFRFNMGEGVTGLDMLEAVMAADSGLTAAFDHDDYPLEIHYRRPTRPGDILPETGNHPGLARWTAYTFDHTNSVGTWGYWTCDGNPLYASSNMTFSSVSHIDRLLVDGSWDAWSITPIVNSSLPPSPYPLPPTSFPAAALYYPFATQVKHYHSAGDTYRDPLTRPNWQYYTNPYTALGRPTVDTTGDNDCGYTPLMPVPVVPVYAAFRHFEMCTLGTDVTFVPRLDGNGDPVKDEWGFTVYVPVFGNDYGELILGFDNPVYDNPDNPFGATFIVFGNSMQVIGGGAYWRFGDPALTTVSGDFYGEGGEVYVSQNPDGPWHKVSYGAADPRFNQGVDNFAPTLGRVYDPANAVTSLLNGNNRWWGGATDPTIPVDPAIVAAHLQGMSVAQVAERYRGSAGGTAFSIRNLDLPRDPDNGMKWIKYVRLTAENCTATPEVNAIASVSPALPIDLWREKHFDWRENPALELDLADASGDGVANLMKYALGRHPYTNDTASVFAMEQYRAADGIDVLGFTFTVNPDAHDVRAEVIRADDLLSPAWSTDNTRRIRPGLIEAPLNHTQGFFRLRAKYE